MKASFQPPKTFYNESMKSRFDQPIGPKLILRGGVSRINNRTQNKSQVLPICSEKF